MRDGKFHQNFTSKTVRKTENFTQISLCWGAALKQPSSSSAPRSSGVAARESAKADRRRDDFLGHTSARHCTVAQEPNQKPETGTVGSVFPGTERRSEDFSLLVAFLLVTFSWLFRGFFVALFCLEKQCSGLFRYFFVVFFVAFSWPRFWATFTRTCPGTVF